MLPNRDGLKLSVRGGKGRPTMSATEWIGASQVIRSRCGSRTGSVSLVQRGILQPRIREGQRDARVEGRVRRLVDRRPLVGALEVERVDRACLDELVDQSIVPRPGRVELHAQVGIEIEPGAERRDRRRVAEPHRRDEAKGLGLALERLGQRLARPGAGRGRAPRSRMPSGDKDGTGRGRGRRARATGARRAPRRSRRVWCEPERGSVGPFRLEGLLVLGAVGGVLADACFSAAVEADDGRACA